MFTRCDVTIKKINNNVDILFESIGEKISSVREQQCRCYRAYPEAVFLFNKETISFRSYSRGDVEGTLKIEFTIPANCDSCDWHSLIRGTGLDEFDFIHVIIDCLNKSANIIDLRNFNCLLGDDKSE